MKPITYSIIFDLDGTLVHSVPDMHYAINKTLKEYNLKIISEEKLQTFVGEGMLSLAKKVVDFCGGDKNLYDIAYRAFRKNAHKELVNFSFDNNGNLVGLITQPVEYLHDAELKLYINVVAQECDRFEYKLTGEDKE